MNARAPQDNDELEFTKEVRHWMVDERSFEETHHFCSGCILFFAKNLPHHSLLELANDLKEGAGEVLEEIAAAAKKHGSAEPEDAGDEEKEESDPDMSVDSEDEIGTFVQEEFWLLSEKEVIDETGKTPKQNNLKEIKRLRPNGKKETRFALRGVLRESMNGKSILCLCADGMFTSPHPKGPWA